LGPFGILRANCLLRFTRGALPYRVPGMIAYSRPPGQPDLPLFRRRHAMRQLSDTPSDFPDTLRRNGPLTLTRYEPALCDGGTPCASTKERARRARGQAAG
jgi:hypothetical protein